MPQGARAASWPLGQGWDGRKEPGPGQGRGWNAGQAAGLGLSLDPMWGELPLGALLLVVGRPLPCSNGEEETSHMAQFSGHGPPCPCVWGRRETLGQLRGCRGRGLSVRGARRGRAGLGKPCPLQPGRLRKVQGIGWYLDEKNLAQVSMNLLDFEVTGLHTVYEETCREAQVSGAGPLHIPKPSCLGTDALISNLCSPPSAGAEPPSGGLTAGGPGASESPAGCGHLLLRAGESVPPGGGAAAQAGGQGPCGWGWSWGAGGPESRAAAPGTCSPGLGSCPCGLLLLLLCFIVCVCKLRSHFSLGRYCWGFLYDLKYIQSCETSVRGGAWAQSDGGTCPSSGPDPSRFGGVSLASMGYSARGSCGPGSL